MKSKEYKVEVDEYGNQCWYNSVDELHREDGPAVIDIDGYQAYYKNDELHREDGPAIICADGYQAYFIDGKELTEEEFNNRHKPVEMTMEEVCKALGKTIKIIKE